MMAGIRKIEDLAKQPDIDVSEYGLKAEGLAILHQAMEEMRNDPTNRDRWPEIESRIADPKKLIADPVKRYDVNFEVDPAFAVPKSAEIADYYELRAMYSWLVSTPTKFMKKEVNVPIENEEGLRIILARSSDEHEMPGKFETHFSLYDPKDFEGSFKNWLNAARKTRESGAGGVIAQALVAKAQKPSSMARYSVSDMEELIAEGKLEDIITFGLNNFGFVANTSNPFVKNEMSMVAVVGLPSKIVRGDSDFGLLLMNKYGNLKATHSRHDYRFSHAVNYEKFPQQTMDIIHAENPSKISSIPFIQKIVSYHFFSYWGAFPFPDGGMFPNRFFDILHRLKEKTGKHIEIESTILDREHFPHILQLRKYDLPVNRIEELSEADAGRIITKEDDSYVADRFSGDLVVLENEKVDEADLRQRLKGDYILMQYNNHPLYWQGWGVDIDNFKERKGLVIPTFNLANNQNPGSHTFAYTLNVLVELQKKGPVISLFMGDLFDNAANLEGKVEQYKGFRIIRNVTVESDGNQAQIYFNS